MHAAPIQTKILGLPYRAYVDGLLVGQYASRKKADDNTRHISNVTIRFEGR